MAKVWETVAIVFLGLFAMGNIDGVADSVKDVGAYGTSTGSAAELFFFLFVFFVVVLVLRAYFSE